MNKFYSDLLTLDQCSAIKDSMLSHMKSNRLVVESGEYSKGTLGFFNLKETLDVVNVIEKQIKKDYSDNLIFENTYARIYKNGHELKIHTDRPGLDITLSVCIYSTVNEDWPIHVSTSIVDGIWHNALPIAEYKKSFNSYVTLPGSGVACLGTRSPHWRDPLSCLDDQMIIQAFFHWKKL